MEVNETKKTENAKVEPVQTEPVKTGALQAETAKAEAESPKVKKAESDEAETHKAETQKTETQKTETQKTETPKTETAEDKKSNVKKPENITAATEKPAKKGRGKVICLAVLAGLVIVLAAVYISIGVYYQTRFLPNTIVNDRDVSGMDAAQVAQLLDVRVEDYTLEITGRNPLTGESGAVLGTITPNSIQLDYLSTESTLTGILEQQEWLLWIKAFLGQGQQCIVERGYATFDKGLLKTLVESWDACQAANMLTAKDACIGEYNPNRQIYEVTPETRGTELDVAQAVTLIEEALLYMEQSTLDLEDAGLYAEAKILQDDPRLTGPVETANLWLGTSIVYDWNGNEVVLDVETIQDWVTIEDGEAILDEEAVRSCVKSLSRKYDTYGKYKDFVTTQGVTLRLASASYGWRTDIDAETEALLSLVQEGSVGSREPVYTHRGMIKASDGINDVGNTYVEADLTNQHLYLYQDGQVVLETDFVSGKISNGNGTPEGIFGITYKTRDAVLRGDDYVTPVKYWMPFYGNYGMHDANWRDVFGGDIYLNNGSHGCINLPPSMAEQIYQYVSQGFPVICYYYEVPVVPEDAEELPDPEAVASAVDPSAG